MKANYTTKTGERGNIEFPVIIPQAMQHMDGFTLLGFDSWEDVNDEKMTSAITNLDIFQIDKGKIGFHAKDEN